MNSPLNGQGDITFPLGQGLRPYRTEVGIRAHSGTTVGDLGRCAEETEAQGGNPVSCELFQARSVATLARTATSVTLFAGRFIAPGPLDPPKQVTLNAFVAGADPEDDPPLVTTGPVPIDANGFDTRLSVSDPQGRIASFTLVATSGVGADSIDAGDLGIDDLTVNFADGGLADFSVAPATNQILALVAGQSREVPVRITRLNGSNGPIALSVSGLPEGVTAAPVTVAAAQTTATLTLVADPTAPDTDFKPTEATITADPLGDTNVGPGPRTAQLLVRVAKDFELSLGDPAQEEAIEVPQCAPLDVLVKIARDIAFDREVSLSLHGPGAEGLPPGVSAEILPSSTVPPGGALVAERTLRFRVTPSASLDTKIVLEGRAGANSSHLLELTLAHLPPSARIATNIPGSGLGLTPRFGKNGTRVLVHGNGFCPGTTVEVGSRVATAEATLVDDRTIAFNVSRYALTGRVSILPPGGTTYETEDSLVVDSFRNTDGFQFANYNLKGLSLSEFTKGFGADDLFIKINPCWPFGNCEVVTGFLNPMAAIEWTLLNLVYNNAPTSGHCFGIDLAIQRFKSGKESFRHFFPGSTGRPPGAHIFDLPGERQAAPDLESLLDALQIRTISKELLSAWFNREKSLNAQLDTLAHEFGRNRTVDIALHRGGIDLHTVLAYDMTRTAEGADIYVYNSDRPFKPDEITNVPFRHKTAVDESVIHVDLVKKRWSFPFGGPKDLWTGDDDGGLWAIPPGTVPDDPSLPGVGKLKDALTYFIFGSNDGVARLVETPVEGYLPTSGAAGVGNGSAKTNGTIVSRNADHRLRATLEGLKHGRYTQAYIAPGFIATAKDVITDSGVRDEIKGSDGRMTFFSGRDRELELKLARLSDATTMSATLNTRGSGDGSDTAGFADDGALTYAHDGAPTALEFSLTAIHRNGGPSTFVSGPVAVRGGDRLRVEPIDRALRRVRVVVRGADGRVRRSVLRNRGRTHGKLRLAAPKLSGDRLSMRFRFTGTHARAVVGATLRLMRGKRVVAAKSEALKTVNGARKVLRWRLPRGVEWGRYRVVADLRAVTTGSRGSTASTSIRAHRAATVDVKR